MKDKYKKVILILGLLFAVSVFLFGCAGNQTEDPGELIRKPPEQIEMYI